MPEGSYGGPRFSVSQAISRGGEEELDIRGIFSLGDGVRLLESTADGHLPKRM